MTEQRKRLEAMRTITSAVLGKNILHGRDFAKVQACRVAHDFDQDANGVKFQFIISSHGLGKVMSEEVGDALEVLEDDCP